MLQENRQRALCLIFARSAIFYFYELWRLALRPWVVGQAEVHAVRDRRVIVEENHVDGIGIRLDEDLFTEHLIRSGAGLARIEDETVSDFERVDVRRGFLVAA